MKKTITLSQRIFLILFSFAMLFNSFANDQMQLSIDNLKINKNDSSATVTVRFKYINDDIAANFPVLNTPGQNAGCTALNFNFSIANASFDVDSAILLPDLSKSHTTYRTGIETNNSKFIDSNNMTIDLIANASAYYTLLGAVKSDTEAYLTEGILFQVKIKNWDINNNVTFIYNVGVFESEYMGETTLEPTGIASGNWPSMTAAYVENKVPVFTSIIAGPATVVEGQSYTYTVKAKDQGGVAASGIGKIEWFCNSTKLSEQTVTNVEGEDEGEFTLNWTPSYDLQNSANSNNPVLKAIVYDKETTPASAEALLNISVTNVNRIPKLNGTTLSIVTPAQVYITTDSVTTRITNPSATDDDIDDNDYLDYLIEWYIGATNVYTSYMGTLDSNEVVTLLKSTLTAEHKALWVKNSAIKACLFVQDAANSKSVTDIAKDKTVAIINSLPMGSELTLDKTATSIDQSKIVNANGAGVKITGVAATHAELVTGYTDADTTDKLDPTVIGSGLGITGVTTAVNGLVITNKGALSLSGNAGAKVIDFTGTNDYRKLPINKKATVAVGYRVNDGSDSATNANTLTFTITGENDVPTRDGGASVKPAIVDISGSHIEDITAEKAISVPTATTGLFSDVDHGDTVTLSYQWQISKSGSNSYNSITQTSGTAATLTFSDRNTARGDATDYKVRCIISAKDGQNVVAVNSITSNAVTVGPQTLIDVDAQNSVNENETATFTATVTPSTGKTVASAEWEFSVNGTTWSTSAENIVVKTTNTTGNTVSTFTFTPNYLVSTKTSPIDYDVRLKTVVDGATIYSSEYNIAVVNVERDPVFNEKIIVNPPLIMDKADLPANITVSVASGDVATDPDADGEVEITYAWFIKKDGKKYNYNAISGVTNAILSQATLKTEIEGLGKDIDVCQVKCVITATSGIKSAVKEFIVQVGLYEYTKFVIPYGYYGPIELTNLPGSEKPGVGGNQEVWIDGNIFKGKVVNKATFVKEDTKSFAIDITKKLQHYAPGEYTEAIKARKFTMKSASLISPADAGRIYVKSNKVTFEPALDFNTDGAAPVKFDYSIEVEVNGRLYLYTFIGYIKVLPVNDKPVITWSQEQNTAEKGISPIIVATVTPGAANESAQTLTVDTPVIKPTNGFTISPVTVGENGAKIVRFTPTSAGVATALTISVKDDAKNAAADASYYAKVKHTDKPAAVKASIKVISGVANEDPSFVLINDGKVTAEETAKTAGKAIAGSKLAFANTVKAWTTDAAAGIEAKQKLKFTVVVAPADKAKFTKVPTVALDAKSATANMSFTVAPNLLGEIATVTVIATDSGVPAATFAQDVKIFVKALAPTIPTFDISALDAFDEQISTSMVSDIKKFNAGLNIKGTVKSTEIKWFKNVEESEFATGETVTAPKSLSAGDKITVKVTMTPTAESEAAVEWAKSFFVGNPEWFPAVNLSSLKNSVNAGSYQVTMVQGKVTAKVITTVEDARSFIKVNEYIAAKSKGFQPNQEVRITLINKWDGKAFKTPVFKENLKVTPAQTLTFLTTQYGMPDLDTTFEGNVSFDNTVLSCPIDVIDAQGFTYEIWSGIEPSKLKKLLNGTINFSDTMDKYLDDDKNVTTLCSYVLNYNIPTTGFYQVRVKAFNPRYMPKTLIFGDAEEATEITPVAAPTFGTIENIEFFPAIGKIGVTSKDPKSKYTARFSWPVIDGAEGYVLYYKIGSGGKEVKKDMKKLNYFELPTTVASEITWKVIPQHKPDGKKLVENIAGAKTGLIFAIVSDNVVVPPVPAAITANTIKTVYNPTNNTITLEAIDLAENETWNFYIYNLNETVMEVFENQPAKVTIENVQPDEYIIMGSRSVGDETGEWSDEILVK